MLRILALAQQTIRGVDLNGDEQIAPVRGEGGVLTAYQHAQLMAGIPFTRPRSAAAAAAPTAVAKVQPTLAPTPAPTAVSQAPAQPTEIQIADDEFLPKTFSVQVGATVVWTRTGTRPHTVTADDGSFDSGLLRGTDRFQRAIDAAGVYAYYCTLHGGPGAAGMSGVVTVR